jgi:1-acyl-sn-glycerol-3-phosphate acyltransferase
MIKTIGWILMYLIGILWGLVFEMLRLLGIVTIRGSISTTQRNKGVIIASNHPSLWEPLLLVGLLFPGYIWRPKRNAPWGTPDATNYGTWYWSLFRQRMILVPRGDRRGELRALARMKRELNRQAILILFPEGGRTSTERNRLTTRSGKELRPLKTGIGELVLKTGSIVIPVWVDGTDKVLPNGAAWWYPRLWRKVQINIGQPLSFDLGDSYDRKTVTLQIQKAMVDLADF